MNTMAILPRILIVDSTADVAAMHIPLLLTDMFEIKCAQTIEEANELVLESLRTGKRFNVALIELNVAGESGAELAKRLIDITDTNVVVVTANHNRAAILTFQPDSIIVKGEYLLPTSIDKVQKQTLMGTINVLIEPKRKVVGPLDVRINKWIATGKMRGINALKSFTQSFIGEEGGQVQKFTSSASDRRWVNTVVYPGYPGDKTVPCGVQTCLGCKICCRFCLNWRTQTKRGKVEPFVRRLTSDEIVAQVYQAMSNRAVEETFSGHCDLGMTVNFTGAGDGLVYNLHNCARAIRQLAKIEKPQINFIITSVGEERALQEYLASYIDLPRTDMYWSVNSIFPDVRAWLMRGTKGQSIEKIADSYGEFSKRTGRIVTASFAEFKGINNTKKDAKKIVSFFHDRPFKIKLMTGCPGSLNGVPDITDEEVQEFAEMIIEAGMERERVRVRTIYGSGSGEFSGCGRTEANFMVK